MFQAYCRQYGTNNGPLLMATYCYQLELLKVAVGAAAGALEGLLDAQTSRSHAVGNIDNARQLLQLPEELLRDQGLIAGIVDQRLLTCIAMAATASAGSENHKTMQYEADDVGHGGCITYSSEVDSANCGGATVRSEEDASGHDQVFDWGRSVPARQRLWLSSAPSLETTS